MANHLNYFMIKNRRRYADDNYQAAIKIIKKVVFAIPVMAIFLVCDIMYPVISVEQHSSVSVIKRSSTEHIAQLNIPILTTVLGVSEDIITRLPDKNGPEVTIHYTKKAIGHYVRDFTGKYVVAYTYVPANK